MKPSLTKKLFLEELARGRGIKEVCRDYGYKSTSLYYKWKAADESFKNSAEKILASPLHVSRIAASQASKVSGDSWREEYINSWMATGDRVVSADKCGKTMTEIIHAVDPNHPDFDETFYNMVREQELREAVLVEDELKRKAVVENSVQMQKWIIPYMPVVGDKYYRGAENRLKVKEETNNTVVFFQPDGVKGASKLLKEMFGDKEEEIVY
jgi:hypothetical protein